MYSPYNQYGTYYNYMQPFKFDQASYQNMAFGLQGKSVDNLEVVKSTDIPLDGSKSYFPLTDGSMIATKQLQSDGTSKIVIYKRASDDEPLPKYITKDELDKSIKDINAQDIKDLRDELKNIKRQIRDLSEDIKDKKETD